MPYDLEDPRLTAYALGEIDDPNERTSIEAWLAESPEARDRVEDVRRMAEWLEESLRSESRSLDGLGLDRRRTIEGKLASVSRRTEPDPRVNHAPWYAYALAASLLLGTLTMAFRTSVRQASFQSAPAPMFTARDLDAIRAEAANQAPELAFRDGPSALEADSFDLKIEPLAPAPDAMMGMAILQGSVEGANAPEGPGLDRPNHLAPSAVTSGFTPPGHAATDGPGATGLSAAARTRKVAPEPPALGQEMPKSLPPREAFEEHASSVRLGVGPQREIQIPPNAPGTRGGVANTMPAQEQRQTRPDMGAARESIAEPLVSSLETSPVEAAPAAEPLRRQGAPSAQPSTSLAIRDFKDETHIGRRLDRDPEDAQVDQDARRVPSMASSVPARDARTSDHQELGDRENVQDLLAKERARPADRGAELSSRIANETPALAEAETDMLQNAPTASVRSREAARASTSENALTKLGDGMPADHDFTRELPFLWTMQTPRSPLALAVDPSWFQVFSREVLEEGRLPAPATVRIDALVNAIRGEDEGDHDRRAEAVAEQASPVSIIAEIARCPWNPGHRLAVVVLRADRALESLSAEVEFNPSLVAAYRRIGDPEGWSASEDAGRRELAHPPLVAGHEVATIFELVPSDAEATREFAGRSKYVRLVQPEAHESFTVHVRYQPLGDEPARSEDVLVIDQGATEDQASLDFRFTAAAAAFGLALRDAGSSDRGRALLQRALELAESSLGAAPSARRLQLVEVMRLVSAQRARTK